MYEKQNMLNTADKDLMCEFIYRSMGRVLNKNVLCWERPIPQGVSVYTAHPDTGIFEYMFTKDDKFNVVRDSMEEVEEMLNRYGMCDKGGLVLYMNKCMLPIVSKHKQYSY